MKGQGHPGRLAAPLAKRIGPHRWNVAESGCWEWNAAQDGKGYGTVGVQISPGKWKNAKAHRVVYELLVGPIPDGLQIDHLCRNRICVNPAHLEAVTNRENGLRGISPAARNARKTHCPKGHPYDENHTYRKRTRCGTLGRECRTCATDLARARVRAAAIAGKQNALPCETCGDLFASQRSLSIHRTKFHGIITHGTRSRYTAGCRCDECSAAQRAYTYEYGRKRKELVRMGLIEEAREMADQPWPTIIRRPSPSGSAAIVWRVTP